MTTHRTLELLSVQQLSPTVKALCLRCIDGQPLGYIAGQWLNFDVPTEDGVVRRAYSIASAPSPAHPDRIEIAVTKVGDRGSASPALHSLQPGARLEVDGPHGFFTREPTRALPALLVGTGTGLCPLRAMLEEELRELDGPPLQLLFGCRTEADILWREQLQAWTKSHARFSLHVSLSRPSANWKGERGYVQDHLVRLIDPGARPHVYVCGLTKMVSDVRRVLKDQLGYDRRLIHSERYD